MGHSESYWLFLDQTANPADVVIRDMLESWFRRYATQDPDARRELKSRLEADERAGLFELFLHELLLRLECGIEIHPCVPASARRPDFLVSPKAGEEFYLEAVTAWTGAERTGTVQTGRTVDFLNSLDLGDKMLFLTGDLPPLREVRQKALRRFFEEKARQFSREQLVERLRVGGLDVLPVVHHPPTGIQGVLHPKVEPSELAHDHRGIGAHVESYSLDDYPRAIQTAVWEKGSSSAYGTLGKPLVIAMDLPRFNLPLQLIAQGLYGGNFVGPRIPGGFNSQSRNASVNVSAVLTFLGLRSSSFHRAPVSLWHNSNASYPAGLPLTRFTQTNPDVPGGQLHEIFGVPKDWHLHPSKPPEPPIPARGND